MHLSQSPKLIKIISGKLFDPYTLEFLQDRQVITISEETGLIVDVEPLALAVSRYDSANGGNVELFAENVDVVDLSNRTVLPGFIDAHVHFFLHPYSETSWDDQLTKETLVERTIRATNHAKATLLAGFTTVRDLGTEGAADADIALRKCISGKDAIIPGPRYFCANRAVVPTGSYGPKSILNVDQEGIQGITGADAADGVDECRKIVRKQIGAGADWIKVYADYRYRSRITDVAPALGAASIPTFLPNELKEMIETAHAYGVKVAAHATSSTSIKTLIEYGVDTIEHGHDLTSEDDLDWYLGQKTILVPTLAAYYTTRNSRNGVWEKAQAIFKSAVTKGVKIACGGDTGVFAHGQNSLELKLMFRLGADWRQILKWATLGGWECVRSMKSDAIVESSVDGWSFGPPKMTPLGDNEVALGAVRKGFAADIIATDGDLEKDFESAVSPEHICFVMKGGKVYKRDGRPLI